MQFEARSTAEVVNKQYATWYRMALLSHIFGDYVVAPLCAWSWSAMIPVDGIENFPLMGRAIFQKAAKRGDFFQKQVIFRSAWARLMAGRSKHVRYDIDGGDMLAYGLHSGSFPGRTIFFAILIMTEYPFKLIDAVTLRGY
jgi:hypothetical protein